jgi:hypothetical protein
MKVENAEAVKNVIISMSNRQIFKDEDIIENDIPMVAYKLSQAVGEIIRNFPNDLDLYTLLSFMPDSKKIENMLVIDVENEFHILINNRCEPAIYIKNSKRIADLQNAGKFGKYIRVDEDTIFSNSTFHSLYLYRNYIEFITKSEVTVDDISNIFKDIFETVTKYVPIIKDIEHVTDISSNYDSDNDDINIDLAKYDINCTHTALTTGAWDE